MTLRARVGRWLFHVLMPRTEAAYDRLGSSLSQALDDLESEVDAFGDEFRAYETEQAATRDALEVLERKTAWR